MVTCSLEVTVVGASENVLDHQDLSFLVVNILLHFLSSFLELELPLSGELLLCLLEVVLFCSDGDRVHLVLPLHLKLQGVIVVADYGQEVILLFFTLV